MLLEEKLKGKNILFIGVKFYEYNAAICQKMTEYGAKVCFFYERDVTIKYSIVERFIPQWLDQFQQAHYQSILNKTKRQHFDYLLVIRGHKMPLSFVETIKSRNPGIITINYQWDANANSPFLYLLPAFDKNLSFDYKDVEEIPGLKYSPTFYTDEFKKLRQNPNGVPCKYDFFFFGSFLPERYNGLLRFKDYAEKHGYTLKIHFYLKLKYYLYLQYKGAKLDKSLLSFKPMSRQEYFQLFSQSKAIVDVSNKKQTGMAMRVIDALGSGKKVLTTNPWITRDANYNPKQIHVIDMNNIEIPEGFLEEETQIADVDFSIDKFLENLFC